MENELVKRMCDDGHHAAEYRARLNDEMLRSVAPILQNDDPEILTEEVMNTLVCVARIAHIPMFARDVVAFEENLSVPILRRTFLNLKTSMILFNNGWPGKNDLPTESECREWMDSL